ncbi:hypothetical protein GCK72_008648 [Caenorhabditis remanei]|uniref:Uncharacterized protein n=1 Tax=Caenorhabditis remanei TaxID=31234 RepID=A0A6A5H092_CAERE|nr:hypothetical protein GCK72_008648 [Caenorhabditis remanei]KAF1760399.1 hypothetical protein GCK72_008648 [Caenorhabditis remanei]
MLLKMITPWIGAMLGSFCGQYVTILRDESVGGVAGGLLGLAAAEIWIKQFPFVSRYGENNLGIYLKRLFYNYLEKQRKQENYADDRRCILFNSASASRHALHCTVSTSTIRDVSRERAPAIHSFCDDHHSIECHSLALVHSYCFRHDHRKLVPISLAIREQFTIQIRLYRINVTFRAPHIPESSESNEPSHRWPIPGVASCVSP